jgi:hypothetical protein
LYVPWLYALPLFGALLGKLQVLLLHLDTFFCTVFFHATSDFQVFVQPKQARVAASISVCRHQHLLRVGVRAGSDQRSEGSRQRVCRADFPILLRQEAGACFRIVSCFRLPESVNVLRIMQR